MALTDVTAQQWDCGQQSRTWQPARHGELAYLEDAEAAWRIWADRRRDLLQLLRVKYGNTVSAALLVMILSDIEYATCLENGEFLDFLVRNGVTSQEVFG